MSNVTKINKYMYEFITDNKTYYIGCNDIKSLDIFYSNGLDKGLKEIKKYLYNESYINIKGGVINEDLNN